MSLAADGCGPYRADGLAALRTIRAFIDIVPVRVAGRVLTRPPGSPAAVGVSCPGITRTGAPPPPVRGPRAQAAQASLMTCAR